MRVIHRKIRYFTYKITLLLFLSRDEGKHYILLPFRRSAFSVTTWHHRTLPKIPIWPKTLIIRRVWIFGGLFLEKSPSYRRINTVLYSITLGDCTVLVCRSTVQYHIIRLYVLQCAGIMHSSIFGGRTI